MTETVRGHRGSSRRKGGEGRGALVVYAGRDAGGDGQRFKFQPVAVAIGMKPSALPMLVPTVCFLLRVFCPGSLPRRWIVSCGYYRIDPNVPSAHASTR